MKIELLYFDGCPFWQTALENLKSVLEVEGITGTVNFMEIVNDEQPQQEKFLGSPSIRTDGRALWFERRQNYSSSCRAYATHDGVKGFPITEMFRSKIKPAISS